MIKKLVFMMLFTLIAILAAACATTQQPAPAPTQTEKPQIVATIFPLYDFARAVAGDTADVSMLLKPGAETHSYDPPPTDIIKIQDAALFLYIGGETDAWVERILTSMEDKGSRATLRLMESVQAVEEEIVEGMEEEEEEEHGEEEIMLDEHIWTSPQNAILMVNAIALELAQLDPANAQLYRDNAADYCADIAKLDAEFKDIVAQSQRQMLVFGDRFPFRYFADAYGLEYRAAFPGCSTETEASANTLAYLMNLVSDNNMPYIYHIELSNEKVAKAIAEQTGAELLLLHSGQKISREDFENGVTYVDLMRQNILNLRKGLN